MAEQETNDPHSISDVVEGLEELAESEDKVRVADVLDKFGARSFAPVMLIFALAELTPIGAIPGVPTLLALCVALVAAQLLVGRDHIWVPGWIAERSVSGEKMDKATDKLEGIAKKLDKLAKGRLEFLAQGPALRVAAGIIIVLCVLVAPLEVLPWASAAPMLAIAVISLAIMVRDGLAMLLAWAVAGVALSFGIYYYMGSDSSGGGFLPF